MWVVGVLREVGVSEASVFKVVAVLRQVGGGCVLN